MTDSTAAMLSAVALVEAWLDRRIRSAFDALLPRETDAEPLREVGALVASLIALAGCLAEDAARAQGAEDLTQCAHELLADHRQQVLRTGQFT